MRTFKPSVVQVEAAKTVFKAMAFVQVLRPIVEGYKTTILADLGWGHIAPKDSYLLPDSIFTVYHLRCKEERDKAHLSVEDDDYCPLLVAEGLLRDARKCLIDAMEPLTGISWHGLLCLGLDSYHEFIELTLRLLAPYCKDGL